MTLDLQTVLTALSLDCGHELWEVTDLVVNEHDAAAIVTYARASLAQLEMNSVSPYSIDYSPERGRVIREDFYSHLEGATGPETTAKVRRWAGQLLSARDERDWYQGLLACFELMNDPLHGHGSLLLIKSDRDVLLSLIAKHLKNASDQELARRCKEPRTDFDKRLFERTQETGPPTNSIRQLQLRWRYEQLLGCVRNNLSAQGAHAFADWLQRRIRDQNRQSDQVVG